MPKPSPSSTARPEIAVAILEFFARTAGVSFDRLLASRTINEAIRAIPGGTEQTWARRLVETGETLGLRIRSFDGSLDEALSLVGQNMPVCTYLDKGDSSGSWYAIGETRGDKVKVTEINSQSEEWLSQRELRRRLGLSDRNATTSWVLAQAALPCGAAAIPAVSHAHHPGDHGGGHGGGHGHDEPTPFARLVKLLRPERSDVFNVFIFSAVVGVLALASPIAVEALVNTVAFGRFTQPVIVLSLILFTFLAFAAALEGLIVYIGEIMQRRIFVRIIEDLAYRLPRVDQSALDGVHPPELVNRFFDVITVQKFSAKLLLDGTAVLLQTVIGMCVLAFYHPFLLGFDLLLLASVVFVFFGLGQGAVKTAIKESKAKYAMAAWLQDLVRHPTAFKLHSGAQFALDRADQLAAQYLEARKKHFHVVIRQVIFLLGLHVIAATVLLGLGGWLVLKGELTLGQLVAAELIVMVIVKSVAKLGKYAETFYDLLAGVDKLGALFDLPIEPHDKLFHLRDDSPASVKLHDVEMKWHGRPIIDPISLTVEPGTSVAVTGAPGSGKSMLLDLLTASRSADHGHIELDGIDLRELRPDSLREHLALARSVEIFPGTIDENVHLNRPQLSASDVREALDTVGLLESITHLHEGLNTKLQVGGAPLSSTQSTLLMLARAIVGRPRLLLIDGTLDHLDGQVLERVLSRICKPRAPWTLIIATNREDIASRCQQVLHLGPSLSKSHDSRHHHA